MQIGVGRAALQIVECLDRLLDEDERTRDLPSREHIFTARVCTAVTFLDSEKAKERTSLQVRRSETFGMQRSAGVEF
jgi:hypothetical protein